MSDSGDKMNYLYCLDLWFEEHGDYEQLKDYIVTNNDKAAVGKNVIELFEKSIKKSMVCSETFLKEYSVLACQFLTNSKEQPELFVNELLTELNKIMNNEFTSGSADQFYQLDKVEERELRTCSQHGQPTVEFLQENLQAINNGHCETILKLERELEYHMERTRELEEKILCDKEIHRSQLYSLRENYESRVSGLMPASVQRDLEDTIVSLNHQIKLLQQRVAVLSEEVDSSYSFSYPVNSGGDSDRQHRKKRHSNKKEND